MDNVLAALPTFARRSTRFARRSTRRAAISVTVAAVPVFTAVLIFTGAASAGVASTSSHLRRITTVTFVGHGWGSGIGMGQWGAFGYAVRYHFGYERILNHFYGTTAPATLASTGQTANPTISVLISENANLSTNVGYDPVVTAATTFTIVSQGGSPGVSTTTTTTSPTTTSTTTTSTTTTSTTSSTTVPTSSTTTVPPSTTPPVNATSFSVPAGTAIDLHMGADGTWSAYEGTSCASASGAVASSTPIATGLVNPVASPSVAPTAPLGRLLVLCRHDGIDESLRGSIEAYDRSGYERTLNLVPMESYLLGVVPSESSASWGNDGTPTGAPQGRPWGFQALEAQAVAARSYAMANIEAGGWNGYAGICDSTACQVYSGANYETAVTDDAVASTAGEIRIFPSSPTLAVSTQYSASTGGFTAPSIFTAVRDLGDICVVPSDATQCNPNHTWQQTVNGTVISRYYRTIGRLLAVHVRSRNGHGAFGGRAVTIVLHGTKSTISVQAGPFVSAIGLKSNWFAIARVSRVQSAASTTMPPATTTSLSSSTTTAVTP